MDLTFFNTADCSHWIVILLNKIVYNFLSLILVVFVLYREEGITLPQYHHHKDNYYGVMNYDVRSVLEWYAKSMELNKKPPGVCYGWFLDKPIST